uniref:EGF-like domain-containing protein n=1 Tax=Meloidogyne incognita TaxID=6306 RepID=A0A914KV41_MELIC
MYNTLILYSTILLTFTRPLKTESTENSSLISEQIASDLHENNENEETSTTASQNVFTFVKRFQIVCCMDGIPQLSHPELVRNFKIDKSMSYIIAGHKDYGQSVNLNSDENCRLFKGSFMLPQSIFGIPVELSYASHVICRCPELALGHALDRSCRRLPKCQNNGFRSLLDPRRCFCLEPFFGERCEKFCDRGRRVHGPDGIDYCSCTSFYRGEECKEPICLNGGRPLLDGCVCKPHFFGPHCEFDGNLTHRFAFESNIGDTETGRAGGVSSRFRQRFENFEHGSEVFSTRDVSGTVFSLVMIIVLVLSMYLLMKHRMQVQNRYLNNRRTDLLGACNFPPGLDNNVNGGSSEVMSSRHVQLPQRDGYNRHERIESFGNGEPVASGRSSLPPFMRSLGPFFTTGDGGPPPYTPQNQRVRRSRNDVFPPLPSYEDATKLPVTGGELQLENEQDLQNQERQGQVEELCNTEMTNEAQIEHENIRTQLQTEGIIEEPINEERAQEMNENRLTSNGSTHQTETQNR